MDIQELRTLYNSTYSANYHLVLVTKHRRKCISPEMLVRLKEISTRIISTWEGELLEFNGESDHVHLLLSIPPKVAPSALVNNLKTVTARLIRKEFAGALAKVYDKPVFWSRSYCIITCGGAGGKCYYLAGDLQGQD